MSNYFEVHLSKVPSALEEELSALCFEFGASGVSEHMAFTQMREDYAPEEVKSDTKDLVAYFDSKPGDNFTSYISNQFKTIEISLEEKVNKDWMHEWKKDFKAFCLAADYWVVPSWLEVPAGVEKYLSIDPGMAFGTGTHETTQLAADIILNQEKLKLSQAKSVLDVGTGTGILAMLCRAEFASKVVGTEIDADARVVARENFAKNKMQDIELPDIQIEALPGKFDFVIANIIDGVLTKLKAELIGHLEPKGYLLLTGILEERDNLFITNFLQDSELEIVRRTQKAEWIGYLLRSKL